jgi:hypothetical protein
VTYPQQYGQPNGYPQPMHYQQPPQQFAAPAPAMAAPAPVQQPAPSGTFGHFVPAQTGAVGSGERYDRFTAKDNQGKPLLVRFLDVFQFQSTQGTTKGNMVQGVKLDVYDMTTGQFAINASWTPAKLVEQVAHLAGDGVVYGIELVGVPTKSGNTMVSAQQIQDPATLAAAQQLSGQVAARFDQEHQIRQAEAAQQAVAAQAGGFQAAPAGYGAAQAVGYPAPQTQGPANGYQPAMQPAQPAYVPGQPPHPTFVPPVDPAQQHVAAMAAQQTALAGPAQFNPPGAPYGQQPSQFAQAAAPEMAQWQAQHAANLAAQIQQQDPNSTAARVSGMVAQQAQDHAQQFQPQAGPPPMQHQQPATAQQIDAEAVQRAIMGVQQQLAPQFAAPAPTA